MNITPLVKQVATNGSARQSKIEAKGSVPNERRPLLKAKASEEGRFCKAAASCLSPV